MAINGAAANGSATNAYVEDANGTNGNATVRMRLRVPLQRLADRLLQDALNVVVPIGGIGSRFAREGYRFPKVRSLSTREKCG